MLIKNYLITLFVITVDESSAWFPYITEDL